MWVLEKENEELEKDLTKKDNWYNDIYMPELSVKEIEAHLWLFDKFTTDTLTDYLKLDAYELVKNLAKTINSDTAPIVIAYRDWALRTINTLITALSKVKGKWEFFDRMKQEKKRL
jgi:hypothetical protein